jgi:hypothetical protein
VADETREWPSTKECAKADGSQPAEPIRDSGLCAAAKVRMYGCNRILSASSREESLAKGGGVHVRPQKSNEADIPQARPSRIIWVKLPLAEAVIRPPGEFKGGSKVTEPSDVVSLSCASQDAETAQKICAALHPAGIESFSTRASCGAEMLGTARSARRFKTVTWCM